MKRIDEIIVGARFRSDLGDIDALARSIDELGLLHPIVVRPDGMLIAGARRLAAAERLGWAEIPVTIVDLQAVVRGEFAENAHRKDFTPSELVAIGQELEHIERERAKERQGRPGKSRSGNLPEHGADTRDKIAGQLGVSGRTYEKARAVVEAADRCPEKFAAIKAQMDATGNVDRAFKQTKIITRQDEHAKRIEHGCTVDDLVALAESGYRAATIYGDPAWPWETWGGPSGKIHTAVDNHYGTSTIEEIMRLPVAPLAADDCALLLWCTWPHITIGTHTKIIEAWGFKPSTVAFVWVKQNPSGDGLHNGNGYWTQANTEVCFIAPKGSPLRLNADVHQVVMATVGEHSEKPEEVRRRIERLFPGPYLELYGRKPVPRWCVWGNEIASPLKALPTSKPQLDSKPAAVTEDLSIPAFMLRTSP